MTAGNLSDDGKSFGASQDQTLELELDSDSVSTFMNKADISGSSLAVAGAVAGTPDDTVVQGNKLSMEMTSLPGNSNYVYFIGGMGSTKATSVAANNNALSIDCIGAGAPSSVKFVGFYGAKDTETATGNSVTIKNIGFWTPVFGYPLTIRGAQANGNATENYVELDLGTTGNIWGYASNVIGATVYGATSTKGAVERNEVNVKSGTFSGQIVGGWGNTAKDNTVTIGTATKSVNGYIYGAIADETAEGNSVTLSNTSFSGYIYGADSNNAVNNSVNINTAAISIGKIYGALAIENADNNTVTLNNTTFRGYIYGADSNSAKNNNVIINAATISLGIIYGATTSGVAENNSVTIKGNSSFSGSIVGAQGVTSLKDNTVTISDGTVTGTVYGASKTETDEATFGTNAVTISKLSNKESDELSVAGLYVMEAGNNVTFADSAVTKVTITDSTVTEVVGNLLGASKSANVNTQLTFTNAIVTNVAAVALDDNNSETQSLAGTSKITLQDTTVKGLLAGAAADIENNTHFTTLKASGRNHVGTLHNIQAMELAVTSENTKTPVITFTSVNEDLAAPITLSGATTGTYLLLGAEDGVEFNYSGIVTNETAFTTEVTDYSNDAFEVTSATPLTIGSGSAASARTVVTVKEATKTLSESMLGSVALVNQGAEFMASEGMSSIASAASSDGVSAFGAMSGGSIRYNTGSHVDVDGGSLVLGAATKTGAVTVAAFAEAGWADSEAHVHGTKSDGDHDYYGLGVAGRYDFETPFYVEGSVRAGWSKTEFEGHYGAAREKASYTARSLYSSFHLAGGYVFDVTDSLKMDTYARYLLSYLDGDKVTLHSSSQDKLKLGSTTSHSVQVGARMLGVVNEHAAWRVGAAYEHVFGGDADSWINGHKISSPSVAGNSGIFEAGVSLTPSAASPWKFDLGAKGYVGNRRGVTGSVKVQYLF